MNLEFRCLFILFLCKSLDADCQYRFYNEKYDEGPITWEICAETGGFNCLTDLGGQKGIGKKFLKDLNWENTRPMIGLSAALIYCRSVVLRLSVSGGTLTADDAVLKKEKAPASARFHRNLNFSTEVKEFSLVSEVYPLVLLAPKGSWLPRTNLFVFAGAGLFHFDPRARIGGTTIKLAPLKTEGQGFPEFPERKIYSKIQANVPMGLGLNIEISPAINLKAQVNYRKLFTDYLDDVSTTYIDPELFTRHLPPEAALIATELADRRLAIAWQSGLSNDIRGNSNKKDAYLSFSTRLAVVFGRTARH